ncbi:MAG: HEAT repeat domain-containing protein, partial [Deltaproteobacteria bacterium]|nr:HEAT repeat domain-containing protein [Deltaproteobacteria bacterium]
MHAVAVAIGPYVLETAWYSLWELTAGPNPYPFINSPESTKKAVLLCDYEVNSSENVVAAGTDPSFDREDAVNLLKTKNISLEVVVIGPSHSYSHSNDIYRLIQDLTDIDPQVRYDATRYLVGTYDPRVVEPLIRSLQNDTDVRVRKSAANVLGVIGDLRAVEPLIQALENDESEEVR